MTVWLLLELDVLGVLVEESVGGDVVDVVLVARVLGNMFLLVAMILLLLVVTTYVEFLWRKSCEFESSFSTFVPSNTFFGFKIFRSTTSGLLLNYSL